MVFRLEELREKQGLTLRELGALADVPFSTIARYERELNRQTLTQLEKIAKVLNVTPAYLVGWSDDVQVVTEVRKVYTHQPTALAPEHRPNREGRVIKWVNNQRSRLRERRI